MGSFRKIRILDGVTIHVESTSWRGKCTMLITIADITRHVGNAIMCRRSFEPVDKFRIKIQPIKRVRRASKPGTSSACGLHDELRVDINWGLMARGAPKPRTGSACGWDAVSRVD